MAKRAAWAIGGLGAGGALGWMALGSIMWGSVAEAVTGLDSRALLLALGAVLFAGMMEAYRWKLLLPSERVSIARLFLVRNTGNGLNNVSPVRVVAEVVQTAMLRYGDGVSTEKVVSSLVISRLFDLLVTVNLVGAGLIVLPQLAGLRPTVLPLWAMTSAALIAVVLLGRWMPSFPSAGRFGAVVIWIRTVSALTSKGRLMLGCPLLTSLSWMSIGAAAWLVAGAAGIDLPFWLMSMVIVAVTLFSGVVPAPPGAVGVYEFAVISTLGLFSVDGTAAVTFALVIHGLLFLPPTVISILVLTRERQTLATALAAAAHAIRWRPRRVTTGV